MLYLLRSLSLLVLLLCSSEHAYASTLQAAQVGLQTTTFVNCLSAVSDTNAQQSFNDLDHCFGNLIKSAGINWADINLHPTINSGAINWSSVNALMTIKGSAINWSSVNQLINSPNINWTSLGAITFGSGSPFNWTFNSGASQPVLQFGNGTLDVQNSNLTVHGPASSVTFANNAVINGDTARKIKFWMGGNGIFSNDIYMGLDDSNGVVDFSTDSGLTAVDFQIPMLTNILTLGRHGTSGSLIFYNTQGLADEETTIQLPSVQTTSFGLTLPANLPAAPYSLVSDSSGNLSFTGPGTAGSGMSITSGAINFAPSLLNSVTWGAGAFTTDIIDSGVIEPTWTYGNGTTTLSNSPLSVYNPISSRIMFSNGNFVDGQDAGLKLLMGITGQSTNNNLYFDFTDYATQVGISSGSGVTALNTFGIGLINTATNNSFGTTVFTGNVGIGTSTAPATLLVIPGLKAASGSRALCIDTAGNVTSVANGCPSGT